MFQRPVNPAYIQAQANAQPSNIDPHQARTNVAASGYQLGAIDDPQLYGNRSQLRADQTVGERYAQQMSNFGYGGYAGGAEDAITDVRNNVTPAITAMGNMGTDLYNQHNYGAQQYGTGMGGLYDQAGALNAYAQQGPGPSVAQAQLDANTAMAMRQQLALAGSGRGAGGGAAAFRNAAAQQAQIQGQANAQGAMLQAQEAQNWRQAQIAALQGSGALYAEGAGLGGRYATEMGGLGIQGQQGAGQLALGQEQVVTDINKAALAGTSEYEQNLTDIYGISSGVPKEQGNAGLGEALFTVGGGMVGAYVGGPAGAAAGAQGANMLYKGADEGW